MLIERFVAVPLIGLFLLLAGTIAAQALRTDADWRRGQRLQLLLDRTVLGSGLLVAVLFLFASIGVYRPAVLIGLTLTLSVVGLMLLRGEIAVRSHDAINRPAFLPSWTVRFCALVLGLLLLIAWLHSIRPDIAWDSRVYHLTLPKLFLEHGGFYAVPLNVYGHWPLGVELLFGLAMAAHDFVLAKQVHFVFGLLLIATFFASAYATDSRDSADREPPYARTLVGLLASALFLANPVVLYEIRIAYVDVALAFFFVAAFLAGERVLATNHRPSGTTDRDAFLVLGVACGLVCATKLSGVFLAGSLLLVFCASMLLSRGWDALKPALPILAIPLVVLALPWPIKSWILTGNPVYPLLYDTFGGAEWSSQLSQQHAAWQASIGMGRSPMDYALLPWRVITEGGVGYGRFDGQLHLAWLLALPLSLIAAWRNHWQRRALAVTLLYFVVWALTSQQMRFLIPLLALGALAAAKALPRVLALLPSRRESRERLTMVIVMLMLGYVGFSSWVYLQQAPRLGKDLVRLGYQSKQVVVHPIYTAIDDLPETSQLLLLNNNHTFRINRPVLADSFFEASQITELFRTAETVEAVLERIEQLGITHILLEHRSPGMHYSDAMQSLLADPVLARPLLTTADQRFSLLEVSRR